MYKNADCITIGRIWISPIYISFEQLWILFFDILGGDDDFDCLVGELIKRGELDSRFIEIYSIVG